MSVVAPPPGGETLGGQAPKTLKEIEMDHILKVLDKHKGNKPAAAAELGIVLKTLYNKLNQWQEERAKNAG
jgi:DNA-binding NtrC family response regulator